MLDRIFFTVLIGVAALALGLLLRYLLVRRLQRTILDNWLIQLLGALIIFLPLILGAISAPFVLANQAVTAFWLNALKPLSYQSLPDLAWGLIETVLVIVLGVGVARTVMKVAVRHFGENRLDINLRTLIGRIFYIITIIVAFFWILAIWHIAIALPVAVIGTLTVAFTFAIQDILKDLVAGLYILMERPFYIGDLITIGDQTNVASHTGIVENVQIRATVLRLVSGEQVTVPNALVFGGIVINNTHYEERRATITVTLPQATFDKTTTLDTILKTIQSQATILAKPEPNIMISSFTGHHVTLTVRFWLPNQDVASISEVMYTLRTALPDADLTVVEAAANL